MKVVFLDIDGVLNGADWDKPGGVVTPTRERVNPVCRDRLLRLVNEADAKIVLSTSLRLLTYRHFLTLRELADILGLPVWLFAGMTPELGNRPDGTSYSRWDEIQAWLAEHPEVKSYVILEDEELAGMPPEHLVATSHLTCGLQDTDVAQAIQILNA